MTPTTHDATQTRRPNASAARRRAAQLRDRVTAPPPPLPPRNAEYLATFAPQSIPAAQRDRGRAAVVAVMQRADHIVGHANFVKHTSDVTKLVAWAIADQRDLGWQALMSHDLIHDFARDPRSGVSEGHRADRMRRLKALASHLNTGLDAPPKPAPVAHRTVRAPYTPAEDAAIIAIARTQPSTRTRRQMCALVGLCRGAGCGAEELRHVHAHHINDRGPDGIDVTLGTGDTQRTVPVRRDYEDLVRIGITGLNPTDLVIGRVPDRRNVAASVVAQAVILGTAPKIDASRLRTTWIAELMIKPIPIATILAAAGLKSARTLTDLIGLLGDRLPATPDTLRG